MERLVLKCDNQKSMIDAAKHVTSLDYDIDFEFKKKNRETRKINRLLEKQMTKACIPKQYQYQTLFKTKVAKKNQLTPDIISRDVIENRQAMHNLTVIARAIQAKLAIHGEDACF